MRRLLSLALPAFALSCYLPSGDKDLATECALVCGQVELCEASPPAITLEGIAGGSSGSAGVDCAAQLGAARADVGQGGGVHDLRHGRAQVMDDAAQTAGARRAAAAALGFRLGGALEQVAWAVDKAYYLADRDHLGRSTEDVTAAGPTAALQ